MSILKVARMGHPILKQPTEDMPVDDIVAPETQKLVDNMIETMHEYSGIGLAAPQVHENKRLLVAEVAPNPRYPDAPVIPRTVLFNVRLKPTTDKFEEDWEGCLSIPGIRGLVPRPTKIEVQAVDRRGKEVSFKASGFFARVLQHECDHLDGVMFPERMKDLSKLAFIEEFSRFQLDEVDA